MVANLITRSHILPGARSLEFYIKKYLIDFGTIGCVKKFFALFVIVLCISTESHLGTFDHLT